MKSYSLDFLYGKINQSIILAQSYTEIPELSFIIQSCRLKPYSYVFEKKHHRTVLYRWWFDEYGNSLRLVEKNLQITYGDLALQRDKIISTDLYYGLTLDKINKISQLVYLCVGKDEDQYQDCGLVSFLGLDKYWRTYLYWYGEWQHVSPLLIGLDHLKWSYHNQTILHPINDKNIPLPCLTGESWLCCLPASQQFLDMIKKHYEWLLPTLQGNNNG